MSTKALTSHRRFQIWKYAVGHAILLLRSPKGRGFTTRLDILFKNVSFIHLPAAFNNISIYEASGDEYLEFSDQVYPKTLLRDRKLFIVQGEDIKGYVVAGGIFFNEDSGEYSEPSYFEVN